jgi:hypothetical protein
MLHPLDHGGLTPAAQLLWELQRGILFNNELCENIHNTLVYITQLTIDGLGADWTAGTDELRAESL